MSEKEIGAAKSSRTPLILLVLVLVVAVGALVYFFVFKPGSTPVDTDDLVLNLNELVLSAKDLPGTYNTEFNNRFANEEVVNVMGAAAGKTYALDTGRVDGWNASYRRAGSSQIAPEFFYNRVEIFRTAQGASKALSEDYFFAYTDEEKAPDQWIDRSCSAGQECILFSYREVKTGAGTATVRYDMAFRYKNVVVWMYVKGLEGEANEQQLFDAADVIINRINELGQ